MGRSLRVMLCVTACLIGSPSAETEEWVAGDCNFDGRVGFDDMIVSLNWIFRGIYGNLCEPLCDTDHNGKLYINDSIAIGNYVMLGIPLRPPPPMVEVCDERDNDCDGVVDELCADPSAVAATICWDPVTEDVHGNPEQVAGYRVYVGHSSWFFFLMEDVGNTTCHTMLVFSPGLTYYVTTVAYDTFGNVSNIAEPVVFRPEE